MDIANRFTALLTTPFVPALGCCVDLIESLKSVEAQTMEHGEIETMIFAEGMELMRLMLQGHMDHRHNLEVRQQQFTGADGKIRTHCRTECQRQLVGHLVTG